MKTLRRKEREARVRAAAAAEAAAEAEAEAAEAARGAASSGHRQSFPSLDDTAGSLGDLDLGSGRAPTGIYRSPSPSPLPSTRRRAALASEKRKEKVLPLWDGFS